MADRVPYQSLHPVQFLDDQTEGPLNSMSHAERQVFEPRPFCKWWWQEGPVDNCCCCFPLRTGIMLLCLDNLISALVNVFAVSLATNNIAQVKKTYADTCSEGGNKATCEKLLEDQAISEFVLSCAPLFILAGLVLMVCAAVGMRAACTGSSKIAKLYMKTYPFMIVYKLVVMVLRVAMTPATITTMDIQVDFCSQMFFIAYYYKVTWSFYKRRKVMEDMQLATGPPSQSHIIALPLTHSSAVV